MGCRSWPCSAPSAFPLEALGMAVGPFARREPQNFWQKSKVNWSNLESCVESMMMRPECDGGFCMSKKRKTPVLSLLLCSARFFEFWTMADTQRCTNEHCISVWKPGMHCYKIEAGKTWGNRDWSAIDGSVLCSACYTRFIKTGSLEKNENVARRCTYEHCDSPTDSSQFYQIKEGTTAGGQDWSSLVGSVLCAACYERFRQRGTLERFQIAPRQLPESARRCTYSGCVRPHHSRFFYQILEGTTAGGRDWSSLVGSKLCSACYDCFKRNGTLERDANRVQAQPHFHVRPVPPSGNRCTYEHCDRPTESFKFHQIWEGKTAGGQDWSTLVGSVLCNACHDCFKRRGTLERVTARIKRNRNGPVSLWDGSLEDDAEISETELCQRPDLESANEEYISPGPGPSKEIIGMLDTVKRQKANSHHGLEPGRRRCEEMPRASEPSTPLALRWSWMIDGKCPVTGARAVDEFLADDDEDGFEKYLMRSRYDKGQQQGYYQVK